MSLIEKLLYVLRAIGQGALALLVGIGNAFRRFGIRVRDRFLAIGRGVARGALAFARGVIAFPRAFVSFWKSFALGVVQFFRGLPATFRSKDRTIDLLIGTAATVIWCMPVFVVVYVVSWFLSK